MWMKISPPGYRFATGRAPSGGLRTIHVANFSMKQMTGIARNPTGHRPPVNC